MLTRVSFEEAATALLDPFALEALDDDLAAAFPDSDSVNRALHALLTMRDALARPTPRPRSRRAA